jgi:Ca-activated chloride channel homolog
MSFIDKPDILFLISGICFGILYLAYLVRIFILTRKTFNRFNTVFYKLFIRSAYFGLILISLLGPSFGLARKEIPVTQKEIFLLMDLSRSMTADDIQPSRFEKARIAAKKIAEETRNARTGIIIFTEEAFLHSPLTEDKEALNTFLDMLTPGLIENQGSNLDAPIKLALKKFSQKANDSKPVTRFIIFLTDGEDFSENSRELAEDAQESGIFVSALGIGTETGSPIKSEGKLLNTSLNSHYLREICKAGKGTYHEINNHSDNTASIIRELNEWQGKSVLVKKTDAAANKYFYFLLPALILMVADILITLNIIRL